MASIVSFTVGPQLIYRYKHGTAPGMPYEENNVESYSSRTINCLKASWNLCYYLSPILMVVLYRRGSLSLADGPPFLAKVVALSISVYYIAHITRGFGRMSNAKYRKFYLDVQRVKNGQEPKHTLVKYDYSFTHWDVDYSTKNSRSRPVVENYRRAGRDNLGVLDRLKSLPVNIISYIAASSFGRWLIYPGSTALLNAMIEPALIEGRAALIQNHNGKRYKLETYEGNQLDTMFVDRRHNGTDNGNILVITSEGNAAFYEAGCNTAPLSRGYSVLGWNHPGFGSSTGQPYPDQEFNAIDTVVQFAITELKFDVHQIVFFSWSIGGFASSWAAANYPDCKALILDATFDDVLPLAKNRMAPWMGGMVDATIGDYFNLDIAGWVNRYDGPVKLIRRTQDEMISVDPGDVRTNRGNFLLLSLLKRRYPNIVNGEAADTIRIWLRYTEDRKDEFMAENDVDKDICRTVLLDLVGEGGNAFPLTAGEHLEQETKNKLALYLADKHMADMMSTHCVPLPAAMFELPWELEP